MNVSERIVHPSGFLVLGSCSGSVRSSGSIVTRGFPGIDAQANRLRQGYAGPPKPRAKAEAYALH